MRAVFPVQLQATLRMWQGALLVLQARSPTLVAVLERAAAVRVKQGGTLWLRMRQGALGAYWGTQAFKVPHIALNVRQVDMLHLLGHCVLTALLGKHLLLAPMNLRTATQGVLRALMSHHTKLSKPYVAAAPQASSNP
jgi:hypothetical protein